MTRAAAHPAAGRFDRAHGDEDWLSAEAQALAERLAEQMVLGRLYNETRAFADLFDGIDSSEYLAQLQRALRELDGACKGRSINQAAVFSALAQIQRVFVAAARKEWLSDMTEEAAERVMEAAT